MKLSDVAYIKYIWVSPVPRDMPVPSWIIDNPQKFFIHPGNGDHVVTDADGNETTLRGWSVMQKVMKRENKEDQEKLIIGS